MNENHPHPRLQNSQRQPVPPAALDGAASGPSQSAMRPLVRITSLRCRLLDRDNLYAGVKALLDALRYAGAIPGDSENEIQLEVTQEKVYSRAEEKTVIELEL